MLVSHNKRFAFVHIPKTGGTSLSAVLKPYSDEHPLPLRVVGNFFDNRGFERGPLLQTVFGVPRHAPYLDIRTRIGARIDGYYSFAVVRNLMVISESILWAGLSGLMKTVEQYFRGWESKLIYPMRIRHKESITGTITALEASIWWLSTLSET